MKKRVSGRRKILWLDCSSGISGDMLIGALLSAGAPFKVLESELGKIPLTDVSLSARRVRRMGLSATKFDVSGPGGRPPFGWGEISGLIKKSGLPEDVRQMGLRIIKSLFDAEAKVHGLKSAEDVHLHELGSADTIVDVFGALVCLKLLQVEDIYSSPVNLGGGAVETRHGRLSVPAPAAALLLEGVPVYGRLPEGTRSFELTTPTGAALIKALVKDFVPMPPMRLETCGVGAGSRDFKDSPNVLRAFAGETPAVPENNGEVIVIETNIDDMNPLIYGRAMDRLFAAGALDVFLTPIIMKKGRPAIKLSVLCSPEDAHRMRDIIFLETTTLGFRFYRAARSTLPRHIETLDTEFGPIRFKVSFPGGEGEKQMAPEYEDCLKAAQKSGLPLKEIFTRLKCPSPKTPRNRR